MLVLRPAPVCVVDQPAVELGGHREAVAGVRPRRVFDDQALELGPDRPPRLTWKAEGGREPARIGVREVEADEHALPSLQGAGEVMANRTFGRRARRRVLGGGFSLRSQRADPDGVLPCLRTAAGAPVDGDIAVEQGMHAGPRVALADRAEAAYRRPGPPLS